MGDEFAFIPTNNAGMPQKADRAFIRSHVMRGKNIKENSRRSLRKAKQAAANRSYGNARSRSDKTRIYKALPGVVGRTLGTDLSLTPFAGEVDAKAQELLFKC